MSDILESITSLTSLLPGFSFRNVIEILIISFVVYEILALVKHTRSWSLLMGIIVILAFTAGAVIFELDNIVWILEKVSTVAFIGIIIIFQPELRKALEHLGSQKMLRNISINILPEPAGQQDAFTAEIVDELVKAAFIMAEKMTGALIVIEGNDHLEEVIRTGIEIDGRVSSGLLVNIFEKNTPLHDGAVVVRGSRVIAATCYLPLSNDMSISKDLGTRHRAALGVSETSDSLTMIVSEETGRVSVAQNGRLKRIQSREELRLILMQRTADEETHRFNWLRGMLKNG